MNAWWMGIRPKTLSASIAPVIVGCGLAARDGAFDLLPALAALAGGVLIQIGTNLANDVLDFRHGVDHAERLGPVRVTQAGLLSPRAVAMGAAVSFATAAAIGVYLVLVAGWPILLLGGTAILFGVLYTAGPYPLAYVGLGDLFVLLYFGLGAVVGTYYVQALRTTPTAWGLGVAVGALSVAILNVNNLRDEPTDRASGKRTLAVRMGPAWTRRYLVLVVVSALLIPLLLSASGALGWSSLVVVLLIPLAIEVLLPIRRGVTGRPLNAVLGATARLQMRYAILLAIALVVEGGLPNLF